MPLIIPKHLVWRLAGPGRVCLVTCSVSGVSRGSPLVTITGHRAPNRRPPLPAAGEKPPSGSIWSALVRGLHCKSYCLHSTMFSRNQKCIASPQLVCGWQPESQSLSRLLYFLDRSLWCEVNWANQTTQGTFVQINGSWLRFCRLNILMCQRIMWKRRNKEYWAARQLFSRGIFSSKQRRPSEIGAHSVTGSTVCYKEHFGQ